MTATGSSIAKDEPTYTFHAPAAGHRHGVDLGIDVQALKWQDFADCATTDPESFYPEKGGSAKDARAVCRGCPVRTECITQAMEKGERFGVWGGFTERDRRKLKRVRSDLLDYDYIPHPGPSGKLDDADVADDFEDFEDAEVAA